MERLRNIKLLREMGVDFYLPRTVLPNIPSLPITTISPEVLVSTEQSVQPQKTADIASLKQAIKPTVVEQLKPALIDKIVEPLQVKSEQPKPTVATTIETIAPFNLLVVGTPSLVFIAEVKTNPLNAVWERSAKQFFAEIEYACTQARTNSQAQYFSWPLSSGANMQLGEKQLQQLLSGFLQQRIADSCKVVVMFGDVAKQYAEPVIGKSSTAQLIASQSLGIIFKQAQHKRALWQQLQAIFSVK